MCGSAENVSSSDGDQYECLNLQKKSEKTVKTEEDCDATAVSNKYKELTQRFTDKKWDLSFEQIVKEMIKQRMEKQRKIGDSVLVLYSFDSTEHGSDKTNIISFLIKFICMQRERQ